MPFLLVFTKCETEVNLLKEHTEPLSQLLYLGLSSELKKWHSKRNRVVVVKRKHRRVEAAAVLYWYFS